MDRTEIETLISRFLEHAGWRNQMAWSDPDECAGLCDDASEALAYWLERQGIESEIAHETRHVPGRSASHTVLEVGGWTVDLTARQYDEDAPFPHIY